MTIVLLTTGSRGDTQPYVALGLALKGEILDAAKRVCTTRPVYRVTMRDIVLESGMSQGGVYKYFPNIDSVFAAILNETALKRENREAVERIVSADDSPARKVEALLQQLCRYAETTVSAGGGIRLQLMELYAHEPERFSQIRDQLDDVSVLEYVQSELRGIVLDGVASNAFTPVSPVADLLDFIHASIHGIVHTVIRQNHLGTAAEPSRTGDIRAHFAVLSRAVGMLLAGRQ